MVSASSARWRSSRRRSRSAVNRRSSSSKPDARSIRSMRSAARIGRARAARSNSNASRIYVGAPRWATPARPMSLLRSRRKCSRRRSAAAAEPRPDLHQDAFERDRRRRPRRATHECRQANEAYYAEPQRRRTRRRVRPKSAAPAPRAANHVAVHVRAAAYSTADTADALRTLGWDARVLIEPVAVAQRRAARDRSGDRRLSSRRGVSDRSPSLRTSATSSRRGCRSSAGFRIT